MNYNFLYFNIMKYDELVIMGTFKSGTHSLCKTFAENNIKVSRIHLGPFSSNTCYFIPIRNQKEIFLSAYFQDIVETTYEYSLLNYLDVKLDKEKINDHKYLVDTYLNIEKNKNFYEKAYNTFKQTKWTKYDHLSHDFCLKMVQKIDNSFRTIPFKKNNYTIHHIINKNISIVFMDIKIINDIEMLNAMFNELQLKKKITKIFYSNIGFQKFYANEYKYLFNKLKDEKYFDEDYYNLLNCNIFSIINDDNFKK